MKDADAPARVPPAGDSEAELRASDARAGARPAVLEAAISRRSVDVRTVRTVAASIGLVAAVALVAWVSVRTVAPRDPPVPLTFASTAGPLANDAARWISAPADAPAPIEFSDARA